MRKISMGIRTKLMFTVMVMFVAFVMCSILLSKLFLDDFYINALERDMESYANDKRLENLDRNQISLDNLKTVSMASGYKFTLLDKEGIPLLISVPEYDINSKPNLQEGQIRFFREFSKGLEMGNSKYTVLRKKESAESQLMFLKSLQNNQFLLISDQLEKVRGNVGIANTFFITISLGLLIIALGATYRLSLKLVDPIIKISHQAENIAHFNFDDRYEVNGDDEIHRLGQAMNKISNELERRIETLKNTNEKLSEDMTLQRRFIASVSHDFKSPIGIIKGFAESLKLNLYENEAERMQFIDYIIEESDQIANLVEDLLTLARLGEKNFNLTYDTFDFSSFIETIIDRNINRFHEKKIDLYTEIEHDILVTLDHNRMQQVLSNLIENALLYTPSGGVVSISAKEEKEQLILYVSNSSQIVKIEELKCLFDPFYRIESSRSQKTGGQGLGLSIVKGLVNAHGGVVELSYADNKFTVKIII